MTKIVIFSNEIDAESYQMAVHNYLRNNRPGYSATRWCIPEKSSDGLHWMVKQPIEGEVRKWDKDIQVETEMELAKAIAVTKPLPAEGEEVKKDEFYLDKGDVLKCEKTHIRDEKSKDEMITFRSKNPIDVKNTDTVKDI